MKKLLLALAGLLLASTAIAAEPLYIVNTSATDLTVSYRVCTSSDTHNQFKCQTAVSAVIPAHKNKANNYLTVNDLNSYDQVTIVSASAQNKATHFEPRPPFEPTTTCSASASNSIVLDNYSTPKVFCQILSD